MYNIVDDVMININPLYDMIRYQISLFAIIVFEIYIYNVKNDKSFPNYPSKIIRHIIPSLVSNQRPS
jgi:hypothetical protein